MSRQGNGVGNGGGKLTPNLDKNSTRALNLTVLQRIDPFVEEILITAAHVTLYEFNIDLNQWSRKDVEGSLFVVKRNSQPRFQFIVMNRRNTENLIEDVLGDFEYEVQVPYLLYRNASQEVNGIWFYNSHECEAVANLFNRILSAFSKVPPKPNVAASKSEFEELEAVPNSSVIEGPLEPMTSLPTSSDGPDDSFLNFFSAAMNAGNEPPTSAQPAPSSSPVSLSPLTPVIPSSTQAPKPHLPLSSTTLQPVLDAPEPVGSAASITQVSNLVKPSYFTPPMSSGLVMLPVAAPTAAVAPPLHVPLTLQRPYGTPLLQPFPPPNPSPSLTPVTSYGPVITKDKVRDALSRLVQNDQFIDMVYREMLNSLAL